MKKVLKNIITIILVLIAILSISSVTIAITISDLNEPASNTFKNTGNKIITMLSAIGMVISVVALIILGIKYMMGSVEEKAAYKKTLLPYLIGAGFVFAASAIAQMIYNIAST